jgi:nucleoside-triphosphatase THEP1
VINGIQLAHSLRMDTVALLFKHIHKIMADGNVEMLDEEGLLDNKQASSEESVQEVIKHKRCSMLDGINLDHPDSYVHREPLVEKAIAAARESRLLIIRSPPGTGKTSLLQLILQKLENAASDSSTGFVLRPSQPNEPGFDLFDFVEKKTGVTPQCSEEV